MSTPPEGLPALRSELLRCCTPGAVDEVLLVDMVSDSTSLWWRVQQAQHALAAALVPETLADAQRAAAVLRALKSAVDIGNALSRRVEAGLQAAAALRATRPGR